MKVFWMIFILLPSVVFAQDKPLLAFETLADKSWEAEGSWENGNAFWQRIEFSWAMDSSLIIADSYAYSDDEKTSLVQRSHGVRQYDVNAKTIKFWEFDYTGQLNHGKVWMEGKDIYYQYQYGEVLLTDKWEYVSDSEYRFVVGVYTGGVWEKVFLDTFFRQIKQTF